MAAAAAPSAGPPSDFTSQCLKVFNQTIKSMSVDTKKLFWDPVDAKLLPDYYTHIKNPMWLSKVKARLDSNSYGSPQEFVDDMRLIWANCKIYNPKTDFAYKLGEAAENQFELTWAASGLAGDIRSKRANAGTAAPKYAPEIAPSKPSKQRPTSSKGAKAPAAGTPRGGGGGGPPGRRNHEATSAAGGELEPLSPAMQQLVASSLERLSSEFPEKMEEVMGLIPQHLLVSDETGEVELDFERLDATTMHKLYKYVVALPMNVGVLGGDVGGGDDIDSDFQSDLDSDMESD